MCKDPNNSNEKLTFEDILELLEEEALVNGDESPYKPLNFHDDPEGD